MVTLAELYDSYKKNKGHEFLVSVQEFFPDAKMQSFLSFAKMYRQTKWNEELGKTKIIGYTLSDPIIFLQPYNRYYRIIYHKEHIFIKYNWRLERYYKKESTILNYLAKFRIEIDEYEKSNSRFKEIFGDKYNAKENTIGSLYRLCYDDSNKTYSCSLGTIDNLSLYKLKEIERIVNDRHFEESL